MQLFKPIYDRMLEWAKHRHAAKILGGLSFAESSFFPIPPDVMLAPMCLADRSKAWRFAFITTATSLAGGVAGYFIGYYLFASIEGWLQTSHYWDAYLKGRDWFASYGVWAVFIAGFSPIPYKVFTITAGAVALNLPGFILASLIGRGARFYLVAGLIVAGGDSMESMLPRYIERIGWGVVAIAVVIGGYFMFRN
jgi:membrane protein YqaA with SNARE-associated domain